MGNQSMRITPPHARAMIDRAELQMEIACPSLHAYSQDPILVMFWHGKAE